MKSQLALLTLMATILLVQGNNIPGLWTGYKEITNDGSSLAYTDTITFTTDTVLPQDYEAMCTFHDVPPSLASTGTNFDCTCVKLTSAVSCTVQVGTVLDWTSFNINIVATNRSDIRVGHFSRIYTPPYSGSINEYLSYPWPGTPSQSDMWTEVFMSGISSSDPQFQVEVTNPIFDVATNEIQFDVDITDHDNSNIQVSYSYIVIQDGPDLDIEEDLDTNTVEVGLDEVNGLIKLEGVPSGNLRSQATNFQSFGFFNGLYTNRGLVATTVSLGYQSTVKG